MGRLFAAASGAALALASCVSSGPPPGLVPSGPQVTRVEQLSGEYCYFGRDPNVRIFRRGPEAIPFLHVAALAQPTRVAVEASAEAVVFSYTGIDGVEKRETFVPAKLGAVWRGNGFEIRWPKENAAAQASSEGFAVSGSSRKSRLYRLSDGRLIMTDTVNWKAATHTSFPLFESDVQLVAVILDPDAGGCAPGGGSGRRPWSGSGPDLRDPACAAMLEVQVAALMAEEGEEPQVAEALAREAVGGLVVGQGDPRRFSVSSPAGGSYRFEVGGERPSGCELRLYRSGQGTGTGEASGRSLATRRLPACVCNP
jgi:hypothetical protein